MEKEKYAEAGNKFAKTILYVSKRSCKTGFSLNAAGAGTGDIKEKSPGGRRVCSQTFI